MVSGTGTGTGGGLHPSVIGTLELDYFDLEIERAILSRDEQDHRSIITDPSPIKEKPSAASVGRRQNTKRESDNANNQQHF